MLKDAEDEYLSSIHTTIEGYTKIISLQLKDYIHSMQVFYMDKIFEKILSSFELDLDNNDDDAYWRERPGEACAYDAGDLGQRDTGQDRKDQRDKHDGEERMDFELGDE